MKNLLLLAFCIHFTFIANSNELDFAFAPYNLDNDIGRYVCDPLLVDETGIYYGLFSQGLSIEFRRPIYVGIGKIDFQGNLIYKYRNEAPYREKLLIHQFACKKAVINVFEKENRKENTISVFTTVLNRYLGQVQENEIITKPYNKKYKNEYLTANSKDYTRNILIIDEKGELEYKEEKKFYIACFDEHGEVIWKKNYTLSNTTNYKSSIIKTEVNNNGDVLVIEKRYLKKEERIYNVANSTYKRSYDYYTYFITNDGNDIIQNKLDAKDLNPYRISTAVNPSNQNFYIFSIYGDHRQEYSEGYSFGEFTPNGKVIIEEYQHFPSELVSKFHSSVTVKSEGLIFTDNIKNISIVPRDDNSGVYVVVEPSAIVKLIHNFVDLLVLSIDSEGKTTWSYRVPKFDLHHSEPNPPSVNVIYLTDNKLNIVYNELKDNISKSFEESFTFKPYAPLYPNSLSIKRIWDSSGNLSTEEYISENNKDLRVSYTAKGKCIINNHLIFRVLNPGKSYWIYAPLKK